MPAAYTSVGCVCVCRCAYALVCVISLNRNKVSDDVKRECVVRFYKKNPRQKYL